ncbi:MAG: ABC transporter ATP-binding protein, partial [Chloroflexi bacterium]|nr:ABC transporter ATP-binding protein [Chloroflexota bacterium]
MTNRTVLPGASQAAVLSAVALALLTTLLTVVPARAASSVEIQLRPLMGGRYEVGGWAAVAVALVNDGEPTEGNLTAETDGGTVQRFVEMPAGARKVVMLYVQPQAFQRRITVEYQEPNGTVEAEAEIRVLEQTGSQVAIVGDGAGALRLQLTGALDETAPEPFVIGPADIPERPEPLEGISSLIWAADSSGLTEGQRRSLERWVAGGGELILVGGADWQARTAAFANVMPFTSLAALDGIPHEALAAWSGTPTPAVATDTVSSGPLHDEARALVTAEDGTVLLAMRPVGAGRSILIGSDVATEAYRGWEGAPRIWTRLIPSSASFEQFFGPGFPVAEESLNSMTQALSNLPSLEVPPAELLLALIVGYILLIGPVSYIVLGRIDRRELAWVTAPVLVVLFTACSFGIGSSLKGSDVITNQISLIRTSTAGGAATVQSYAGIFSPQRSSYDLRVEAEALLAPLRAPNFGGPQVRSADVTIEQGNPAQLRDLAIGVFGFEGVRADAVIDYEPALSVSWRRDEDGHLIGVVTNTGETSLTDVAYVSSSIGERIGDLAPGEEAEFELPRTNFNGSSASDQVYGFGGFDPSDPDQRDLTSRTIHHRVAGGGGAVAGARRRARGAAVLADGRGPQRPPADRQWRGHHPAVPDVDLGDRHRGRCQLRWPGHGVPGRGLGHLQCHAAARGRQHGRERAHRHRGTGPEHGVPGSGRLRRLLARRLHRGDPQPADGRVERAGRHQPGRHVRHRRPGHGDQRERPHRGPRHGRAGGPELRPGERLRERRGQRGGRRMMTGTPVVETRRLVKRYGDHVAVAGIDLVVGTGEIFGLVGPNGAGKTTTMKILATLLAPTAGEAYVTGIPVDADPIEVRRRIGYMPDFYGVYDDLKVWEYLDFFARCYGVPANRRATMIGELLTIVGLEEKRSDYVEALSRGMRQRLCLAHTLVHDPALLILDEPASGLDPRARVEMREILRELRRMGKTVLVSSHILPELAEMCTGVAIIDRGRLLRSGSIHEIEQSLRATALLRIEVLGDEAARTA